MSPVLDRSDMIALMVALDAGTSMFGQLKPDIRARLFAVVDNPTQETWDDAHSIMLRDQSFRTLWQALSRHTDYQVTSRPSGEPWPVIPTADQLMKAITIELSGVRP